MSEAFAEYVGARYVRDAHGLDAFRDMVEAWERAGEGAGPVWVEGMTARGSDAVMYRRAPALLSRLEERIGEAAFDRFLERYMINEVANTPELLGHLAEVAGPEIEQWFRALLSEGPSALPSGGTGGSERTAPDPERSPRGLPHDPARLARGHRVVDGRPHFGPLVSRVGPVVLRPPNETPFQALARAIVYQQLAGNAAATIHGRVVEALGGEVTPEAVLATPEEGLRGAGLSRNKLAAVRTWPNGPLTAGSPWIDSGSWTTKR
jgi:hypothetical protein